MRDKLTVAYVSRRLILSLALPLIGIGMALFRLSDVSEPYFAHAGWAFQDFRAVIYYPTIAFLSGENPYNAAEYVSHYPVYFAFPLFLPAIFIAHMPFALLPITIGTQAYFLLVLGLTTLLSFVSLKSTDLPAKLPAVLVVAGLVLISRPGHSNLLLGQTAVQFALAAYFALYFTGRSKKLTVIGLIFCGLKPTFGIPIGLLLLAQGKLREVALAVAAAIVLNAPFVFILANREGGLLSLVQTSLSNFPIWAANEHVVPATSATLIDLGSLLARLSSVSPTMISQVLVLATTVGIAAMVGIRCTKCAEPGSRQLGIGIALLAVLLSVYHQVYDLVLLTAPFVAIVGRRFPRVFYSGWHYPVSLLLLCFLAANYMAGESILKLVSPNRHAWMLLASANGLALALVFATWVHAAYKTTARDHDDALGNSP